MADRARTWGPLDEISYAEAGALETEWDFYDVALLKRTINTVNECSTRKQEEKPLLSTPTQPLLSIDHPSSSHKIANNPK